MPRSTMLDLNAPLYISLSPPLKTARTLRVCFARRGRCLEGTWHFFCLNFFVIKREHSCLCFDFNLWCLFETFPGNVVRTTQWHRIVSWDQKRNPFLAERVKKGDLVYVEGPIHYRTYTGKDGTEKHLTEISMSTFSPLF